MTMTYRTFLSDIFCFDISSAVTALRCINALKIHVHRRHLSCQLHGLANSSGRGAVVCQPIRHIVMNWTADKPVYQQRIIRTTRLGAAVDKSIMVVRYFVSEEPF